MITAGTDATLRFWDLEKGGQEMLTLRLPATPFPPAPLWHFDFRCNQTGDRCWIAVPLIDKNADRLVLYTLEHIYASSP